MDDIKSPRSWEAMEHNAKFSFELKYGMKSLYITRVVRFELKDGMKSQREPVVVRGFGI
jgi:hypothetical protein